MMWIAIIVAGLGCYGLKLAGLSLPDKTLANPLIARVADLIPVALLAALVAVQTWSTPDGLSLDARTGGLAFAVVALLARAPFLAVVVGAALTAALLRWAGLP
jgi:branched-subunit amino acid transport protein